MKKLHEILRLPLCKGDVGIEIEAEGDGLRVVDTVTWHTERDGSLRGVFPEECAEFVLRQPIKIEDVSKSLDELTAELKGAKFNFSFRTSAHVHVNVQELTGDEVLAYLYLVLLLEEPLMSFCGESRQGNRFCLRLSDAEGYIATLSEMFKRCVPTVRRLDGNNIRYAAINIHSLRKYGSIEFRGMRGNISKEIMVPWCETLTHLRDYAREIGDPVAMYNKYISTPGDVFIKESLGKHAALFYDGDLHGLERSFSLTIDLPHLYKNRDEEVEEVRFEAEDELRPRVLRAADGRGEINIPNNQHRIDIDRAAKRAADLQFQNLVENNPADVDIHLGNRIAAYMKMFKEARKGLLEDAGIFE